MHLKVQFHVLHTNKSLQSMITILISNSGCSEFKQKNKQSESFEL